VFCCFTWERRVMGKSFSDSSLKLLSLYDSRDCIGGKELVGRWVRGSWRRERGWSEWREFVCLIVSW
jgi:hypothetical protein